MSKIRFYHIRTLLWTYLVWAALNLWIAFRSCDIAKCSLTRIPYYWVGLHIIPFLFFLPSEIRAFGMVLPACAVLSASVLVAGLLIKGRWACFLIIIGMSIWFLGAFYILAMGV